MLYSSTRMRRKIHIHPPNKPRDGTRMSPDDHAMRRSVRCRPARVDARSRAVPVRLDVKYALSYMNTHSLCPPLTRKSGLPILVPLEAAQPAVINNCFFWPVDGWSGSVVSESFRHTHRNTLLK